MHIDVFIKRFVELQILSPGAHVAHSSLSRFFHYIPKLAGDNQIPFARHNQRFNAKQFAANLCPGKSRNKANLVPIFHLSVFMAGGPQIFLD